jgi:flavin-dependent dehydrogenase
MADGLRAWPGDLPGYFRTPRGPGWALVGDAGYHRDPLTAQGISDAFRDAQFLAEAIDAGLAGRQPLAEALAGYQGRRDEAATAMYELTLPAGRARGAHAADDPADRRPEGQP